MRRALAIALFGLACGAGAAQAACRQALALGLDVSGSVDAGEYILQKNGLAGALRHPEVAKALLSNPAAPVMLAVYEWSAQDYQRVLVDWTAVTDAAALDRIAGRLEAITRQPAPHVTGLGQAVLFGSVMLEQRTDCWRRTLDISGDGRNNSGPRPEGVRDRLTGTGITVNALVIGTDASNARDLRQVAIGELIAYFRENVILGENAFVEVALGFTDYEKAMVRKLLRELDGLVISTRQIPARQAALAPAAALQADRRTQRPAGN